MFSPQTSAVINNTIVCVLIIVTELFMRVTRFIVYLYNAANHRMAKVAERIGAAFGSPSEFALLCVGLSWACSFFS